LVDPPLRQELDEFFILLKQYRANYAKRFQVVEEKLLPHLRAAFGKDVEAASYQISARQQNGTPIVFNGGIFDSPILAGEDPVEFSTKRSSGLSDLQLELSLQRAGKTELFFGANNPNPDALEKFNSLLKATTEEVKNDPLIVLTHHQRESLIIQAGKLREKLRVKTEEPWNV